MNRQAPYPDASANRYADSHLPHMSAQRMQQNAQISDFSRQHQFPYQPTFEGLEQRFQDEMMKLIKDVYNAEDKESVRHKERLVEINRRYQEKLSSLRVQHASQTGEFRGKESQTRLHHFQQGAMTERGPSSTRLFVKHVGL